MEEVKGDKILRNPTVGDLRALLETYDQTKPLRIEDPDTGWTINVIHFNEIEGTVWLSGDYSEMNTD